MPIVSEKVITPVFVLESEADVDMEGLIVTVWSSSSKSLCSAITMSLKDNVSTQTTDNDAAPPAKACSNRRPLSILNLTYTSPVTTSLPFSSSEISPAVLSALKVTLVLYSLPSLSLRISPVILSTRQPVIL